MEKRPTTKLIWVCIKRPIKKFTWKIHISITEEQLNGCFENVKLKEMVEKMSNAHSGHTRDKIDEMTEKLYKSQGTSQNRYKCKSCGKEAKARNDLAKHIELHLNISYPCIYCENALKTSYGLKQHLHSSHPAYERRLN